MQREIKLDGLHRVHIPTKFIQELNWKEGDKLIITLHDGKISISSKPLDNVCPVCTQEFTQDYSFCPYCGQYLLATKEDK